MKDILLFAIVIGSLALLFNLPDIIGHTGQRVTVTDTTYRGY